ncbi:MAG: sodium:proton antiporter, partial [Bacteroidales bacterium]|nr:sodium:proton antiporter [Bacteroidales bacterium]
APRGLITILLFISIPSVFTIPEINTEVITLVILMTMLTMMLGNIIAPKKKKLPEVIKTEPRGSVWDNPPETGQD